MVNVTKYLALAVAVTGLAAFSGAAKAQEIAETDQPVMISVNNWTSQLVLSHVAGQLLQKLAYNVKYVPADGHLQFAAMQSGDLHFQMEIWEGGHAESWPPALATGQVMEMGTHDATSREDWWYPTYLEEVCPGLPDWTALNNCAEILSTPETAPKGRYLAGPAEWFKNDQERVAALELDIEVVNAGSVSALWAELDSAYRRNEPIIVFNWTPNWVEAKYVGKFIEFPDFEPECLSDPSWGLNPDLMYDCGNIKGGWLKKAAWVGVDEKFPAAGTLFRAISFSNAQISAASALVDVDEMTHEEAASKWIEENEAVWNGWLEAVYAKHGS